MSYRNPAGMAASGGGSGRAAGAYVDQPPGASAAATSSSVSAATSSPHLDVHFHRSAPDGYNRPTSLPPPRPPPPHLTISAASATSYGHAQSPSLSSSALHTSSSFPLSLAQSLSSGAPSSSSPGSSTAVSPSPSPSPSLSLSQSQPASSFPAPASRRPRPRSSRPYQSLLKSASAEEASTSDDESRWQKRTALQQPQTDVPPYALMHGNTYMPAAYTAQHQQHQQQQHLYQPHSSPPIYSSSANNSPVISSSGQQPALPSISQPSAPFSTGPDRPSYPQSRSRSNSLSSAAAVNSAAQGGSSLSSSPLNVPPYTAARGAALPAEPSAVGTLLASARSLLGLATPRQSPNSSPLAAHAVYTYQPSAMSSVTRAPPTISPSASPLTLSHYSSAYPPPPLPASMHSLLPPIHDDDVLDSDEDVDGELRVLTGDDSDWSTDEEADDPPTTARHDKYGRQRARNVRVIRLRCPSFLSCKQYALSSLSWDGLSRWQARCSDVCCFVVSPDLWIAALLSVSCVKSVVNRYKELPWSTREKLMFMLSSTLGTVLFLFLFESFMIVNTYDLEDGSHGAFTVSYLLAYIISIAWQHALHRLLVFQSQPYCLSLLHTYLSYSFSLAVMALVGAFLIDRLHISARLVACVTLPGSAIANYYLLRGCITLTERWQQAQPSTSQHPSPITRPFGTTSQPPYLYPGPYAQPPQQMDYYATAEPCTPPASHPTSFPPSVDDLSAVAVSGDGLSPLSVSPDSSVYLPYRSAFVSQMQSTPTITTLAYHSRGG